MDPICTATSLSDVQDILYYIVPHLDPDRSSWMDVSHARQTLLSSALTCRNFTRPALNTLWRSLPGDKPLVSLLCTLGIAQDSRCLGRELDGPYGSLTLDDPRIHPNWDRFREYAARVRKIQLASDSSVNPIDQKPSFWTKMSQLLHDEPILPLLQSVNIIGDHTVRTLCAIPLPLISPSVRNLGVWVRADTNDLEELERGLTEACARAPHLETITLSITPWSVNLSILHGNSHLRSITIHATLTIEDLVPLAYLAELEDLSVVLGTARDLTPTLNLSSLRRLSVRSVWVPIHDLLECIEAPHIRSLTLHATHDDSWQFIDEAHACLQATATNFSALEVLSVNCARSSHALRWALSGVLDTEGTLMAVVEPLLSLRLLRHLTLDLRPYILRHTSDDLRRFAEAWPDVEELIVSVATVDGGRAGFECIAHFACRCPRLRALRLPAMDLVADAFDGLEYPAEAHPLRDLDVAEVVFPREADLSHEMTTFIQRVFPNAAVPFAQHPIVVTDEESGDRSRLV